MRHCVEIGISMVEDDDSLDMPQNIILVLNALNKTFNFDLTPENAEYYNTWANEHAHHTYFWTVEDYKFNSSYQSFMDDFQNTLAALKISCAVDLKVIPNDSIIHFEID